MATPGNPGRRDPTAPGDRRSAVHGPSAGTGRPPGTAAPSRNVPPAHNAGPRTAVGWVGGKERKKSAGAGDGGREGEETERKEGKRNGRVAKRIEG